MSHHSATVLPKYSRGTSHNGGPLLCIGNGSVGVKARELWEAHEALEAKYRAEDFPDIEVRVPQSLVLAESVFASFLSENGIRPEELVQESDSALTKRFFRAEIPPQYCDDLEAFLDHQRAPLVVRSSPILADHSGHALTDVFASKTIPNNQKDPGRRMAALHAAIKLVWASAFFDRARAYSRSMGFRPEDTRMAVVIQEAVGRRYSELFYPCITGVARSYNFYPTGQARPEEGVVLLALGLGKRISDGGLVWSFVPEYPNAPPPFEDLGDLLKHTQTTFWALNLTEPQESDPSRVDEFLVERNLERAETDGALKFLVSTYHIASDRLHPGLSDHGPHALTFAPVLGSQYLGLSRLIEKLIAMYEEVLGSPIEIEFAVDLDHQRGLPARVAILQVQPMHIAHESATVSPEDLQGDHVLVASEAVLGNGRRTTIQDIVYLKPESFDVAYTRLIAHEIAAMNACFRDSDGEYLLIGFGRWGTSDPWLGMPVKWNQISSARVIVEVTLPDIEPDLSQGSAFFQYLLSHQILYLSVEQASDPPINWEWLRQLECVAETDFVAHVRCPEPLDIRVQGAVNRGIIRY